MAEDMAKRNFVFPADNLNGRISIIRRHLYDEIEMILDET